MVKCSPRFRARLLSLIKEAKISCPESTIDDKAYELSPELWEIVCDEFGYYDYELDKVHALEDHSDMEE